MNGSKRRQANLVVGGTLLTIVALATLAGLVYLPFDPTEADFSALLLPPSTTHWFGTDQYGRDLFSRVLGGASVSAGTSIFTVVVALGLGTLIGGVSGYWGGLVDRLLTVVNESLMALPSLLLALVLILVTGPSMTGVVLTLGLTFAPSVARIVRGTVISVRERDFVEASRVLGNNEFITLVRHVLPNCISPLTVVGTSLFANALLLESALSFLGLGVPPPAATWGGLLADSRQFIGNAAWLGLFPGLAISFTLLGINLAGDALRDHFDPRMHGL